MLPEKFSKFRVSEMPSPAFSVRHFQEIKTKENAVISCLFYPSLVLLNFLPHGLQNLFKSLGSGY